MKMNENEKKVRKEIRNIRKLYARIDKLADEVDDEFKARVNKASQFLKASASCMVDINYKMEITRRSIEFK